MLQRAPPGTALGAITAGGERATVLILDDDEIFRYILKDLLGGSPCRILEAASGKLGLERAQTELSQPVFLDVVPDLSGFDGLTTPRSNPKTARPPVIVMTTRVRTDGGRAQLERRARAVRSKTSTGSRDAAAAEVRQLLARSGLPGFRDTG